MYILLLKCCNIRYVFFILCGNKDYYYYYYNVNSSQEKLITILEQILEVKHGEF